MGSFVVGQDQDFLGGGFEKANSFHGRITQLNMWGRLLPTADIENIASCQVNHEMPTRRHNI